MRQVILFVLFFLAVFFSEAQSVLTGPDTGDSSLLLDIQSDYQGLLIPRMTESERDMMPGPPSGTQIFNETRRSLDILGLGWHNHFGLKIPQSEIDSGFLAEESWKILGDGTNIERTNVTFVFDTVIHFINANTGEHAVYNTLTSTWSIAAAFPDHLSGPISATQGFQIGNRGYMLGQWDSDYVHDSFTQRLWAYNPAYDEWEQKTSCPLSRFFASSFVINGKAYLLGGATSKVSSIEIQHLQDFYEYNPVEDAWKRLGDFNVPIHSASAFSLNGKGYTLFGALGFLSGEIYTPNLYEYNPLTDTWSFRSSLSFDKKRFLAMGFSMNGKIYGGFGRKDNGETGQAFDFWEYDPVTLDWTEIQTPGLHYSSGQNAVAVLGDKAYFGGKPFSVFNKKKYHYGADVTENQIVNTGIWEKQNDVLSTDSPLVGISTAIPQATLDINGSLNAEHWFSEQLTENGFVNMAGVLLQWGTASYSTNNIQNVVFPTPFQALYSVTATLHSEANNGSGANAPVKLVGTSLSGFNIAGTKSFSGDTVSKVRWIAVGKPN